MIWGPDIGEVDDGDVVDAYPWPGQGLWVRSMMVSTLDGAAAGPDGLSGSISGDADRAVFDAVRRLADAVLVGAGTVRAEKYGPMRAKPDDAARREQEGQAPAPRLAIVSGSLDLPWDSALFSESTLTPLVITTSGVAPERRARAERHSEVVAIPGDDVDALAVVEALVERGLPRIVCEGGPSLLRAVAAAGLLDEVDLTISPLMAGTANTPRAPMLGTPAGFSLRHVLEAEGFLMCRYLRGDGG